MCKASFFKKRLYTQNMHAYVKGTLKEFDIIQSAIDLVLPFFGLSYF